MSGVDLEDLRLTARALFALRLAWGVVALLALISVAAGVPSRYAQLATVSPAADTTAGQLRPADAQRLAQGGLTPTAYAVYFTLAEALTALLALGVAGLIVWGRAGHRAALLVSLNLVGAATALPLVPALAAAQPQWGWLALAWRAVFAATLPPIFYVFPDGRFVPRWTRWLAGAWLAYTVGWLLVPSWRPLFSFGRGLTAADVGPILPGMFVLVAGVLAQIWRYRRVSTALERQRTRWVVFGFSILLVCFVLGVGTLTYMTVTTLSFAYVFTRLAGPTLIILGFQAVAISIGFSVVRYRLWDIDVIIRRTLIYSALTLVLAVAYFASVVVLQNAFRLLTGQAQSQLVTVLSTLTMAALFGPLRAWVQRAIDRRFYRRKYDAARTLAGFAAMARDEVDLDRLSEQLVRVVDDTMQPKSISLWLRQHDGRSLKSVAPAE